MPGILIPTKRPDVGDVAWTKVTWIAGAFCAVIGIALLIGHLSIKDEDPLNSAQLKAYREKLRFEPGDEQLKTKIRQLDFELRRKYFNHVSRTGNGIYLLIGGSLIFLLSARQVGRLRKQLPMPKPRLEAMEQGARVATLSRWSLAAVSCLIGFVLLGLTVMLGQALPKHSMKTRVLNPNLPDLTQILSIEELKRNWPRFRGLDGNGASSLPNAPLNWDVKNGAGIAWRVPVPGSGFNSPAIWSNHLFLTAAHGSEFMVCCLEMERGRMQWRQTVLDPNSRVSSAESIPMATASTATDGHCVYAFFGSGMLAAYTMEGQPVWSKHLGPLKNTYGHASSLSVWHDRLILQLDQGEAEGGRSKLYAFAATTGEVIWERSRKAGSSWATPLAIEAGGRAQIVTLAVPAVISYAARDGAELWRVEGLNGEITPSPAYAGGLLYVISPSEKLLAIRPDGSGDVTKTHVVWSAEDNVPDITSPTTDGELLFTLSSPGVLTCFDAKDGKKQWEHDFEMEFHSSPSISGGRVYVFSLKGVAIVVEAGRQFREIFRTDMQDSFSASPAFAPNRIFIRGETNLWSIGTFGEQWANKK